MKQLTFLLRCYNNTPIDKEKFFNRVKELYEGDVLSDYAVKHIFNIVGVDNE